MRCKECKWLGVAPGKDGKVRVAYGVAYPCLAPVPEQPKLPTCVISAPGFCWPPQRLPVYSEDGKDCLVFSMRID